MQKDEEADDTLEEYSVVFSMLYVEDMGETQETLRHIQRELLAEGLTSSEDRRLTQHQNPGPRNSTQSERPPPPIADDHQHGQYALQDCNACVVDQRRRRTRKHQSLSSSFGSQGMVLNEKKPKVKAAIGPLGQENQIDSERRKIMCLEFGSSAVGRTYGVAWLA
ncbi:hypothetical protein AXG93_2121s1070 [Marchantia polymorpha subsp. ruderalis]|uniref:Uncharacterized protein n=1 Tax=Marchantia polymorpha subsp. ruderalis TaxID=1480154 RepID=A0A176WBX2_MARPO|nr:hypothetical protein AXG93_2121s1070 [Marchantia polymorpha subsp. ruderalis]